MYQVHIYPEERLISAGHHIMSTSSTISIKPGKKGSRLQRPGRIRRDNKHDQCAIWSFPSQQTFVKFLKVKKIISCSFLLFFLQMIQKCPNFRIYIWFHIFCQIFAKLFAKKLDGGVRQLCVSFWHFLPFSFSSNKYFRTAWPDFKTYIFLIVLIFWIL